MDLTDERKAHIDSLDHYSLLQKWRFTKSEDPWIQGETGKYWGERMAKLRDANPGQAVQNSKDIGWD